MKGKTAQYDSSLLPALSQQMNACGFRHDLKKKKRIWFLEFEISEFYHTWAVSSQCEEHYFTLKLQFSILILK